MTVNPENQTVAFTEKLLAQLAENTSSLIEETSVYYSRNSNILVQDSNHNAIIRSHVDPNQSAEASTLSPTPASDIIYRSEIELICLGVLLAFIIAVTIFGNLLVIVTVLTTKKIQTPTNYFILSLSITDLCIGTLVMPFSAVTTLHWEWPLGAIFCNIYISIDVMLCTVSILTLFAISLDRYVAVTKPLRYQQKVTCTLVFKVCTAIWVFSFVLAFLPIHLGWNTETGIIQNYANPRECVFELNKIYVLMDSVGTYFAPLFVMCGVYLKVLLITKRQVQEINKMSQLGQTANMLHPPQNTAHRKDKPKLRPEAQLPLQPPQPKLASDTKATITLATLVLAFAICWIPYFVIFSMKPFVAEPVNVHFDLFCLWLGYVNSAINPFLYAYYNTTFRNAFARVLCRGILATYIYDAKRKQRQRLASTFTESSELAALNARLNGKSKRPSPCEDKLPFTVDKNSYNT